MPSRRKTREFVLQVLFAADAAKEDALGVLEFLQEHFKAEQEEDLRMHRVVLDYARGLVEVVVDEKESIDELIARLSEHWKIHRMNMVDRNILRMAIAEMTHFSDTPGKVVMDEAIEIGKRYGAENSAAFINGILDRIHTLTRHPTSAREILEAITNLDESPTTD